MPSNAEILGWVEDLVDFGPRRTGTEGGVQTANYIAERFRSFGLQGVTIEHGDTLQWRADEWSLTVDGEEIPSFAMPHSFHPAVEMPTTFSTGPDGLEAELVYVGEGRTFDEIDVRGKIVVADVLHEELPVPFVPLIAESVYDPDETIPDASHIDPFTPNNFPYNLVHAMERGAVGFIGILANYLDSHYYYNEDATYYVSDDAYMGLPGLWVSRSAGAPLKALLESSEEPVRATIRLEGEFSFETYNTVLGYLPGGSDETIVVQSHHDSTFGGAVEDGTGSAEVLALAKYFSGQPASERRRRLMFITMDTHFTKYDSHRDVVEKYVNGPEDKHIVATVGIEHIGLEMKVGEAGEPVMTGRVETHIFVASPTLADLTGATVEAHDYRRAVTLSTEYFSDRPGIPTDLIEINKVGVPVISLISAPVYLYDLQDTVDKVAVDKLKPTAELFADLIAQLDAMPAEEIGIDTVFLDR